MKYAGYIKQVLMVAFSIQLIASTAGCKVGGEKSAPPPTPSPTLSEPMYKGKLVQKLAEARDSEPSNGATNQEAPALEVIQQKIIYTAEISLEVTNYEKAFEEVKRVVAKVNGYIADSAVDTGADGSKEGTIEIRVPASSFNEALEALVQIGKVKYKAEHGSDVTEEYYDLEARLANARKMESRLLELLEKKTNDVGDLLEVETKLGEVRENIERMEGRKRLLDDRLTMSTITINISEPHKYTASVFDPIKNSLRTCGDTLMRSLASLLEFLAGAIPWIITGLVFLWILIKLIKRALKGRGKTKHENYEDHEEIEPLDKAK